jgi:hypothetical protein|tara:strand:+ start:887 stop:1003 length:117 start_codon:yes stop_codon:yes gene_type:complete
LLPEANYGAIEEEEKQRESMYSENPMAQKRGSKMEYEK